MTMPGDVLATVSVDEDGYASIFINEQLAPEARKRAFMHELRHIRRGDMYNDHTIEDVEAI